MIISNPKDNDTAQMLALWKYCFGDGDAFLNYFFSSIYKPKDALAVYDGDSIVSCLHAFPHKMVWHGTEVKMRYIAGVSTAPEYRGKGLVKKMLAELFAGLLEEGVDVAALIPFRFDFYRRMGFECISYLAYFEGDMRELIPFSAPFSGGGDFSALYNEFVKDKDIYIKRDEKAFEEIWADVQNEGGYRFITDGGYIFYYLQNGILYVPEIVYTSEAGLRGLLGFIASHSSQASGFKIRGDISLAKTLCESAITVTVKPHVMAFPINKDLKAEPSYNGYINMLGWV